MMKHKDDTVGANVQGVGFLLKKNKVDAYFGAGSIPAAGKVEVTAEDGSSRCSKPRPSSSPPAPT